MAWPRSFWRLQRWKDVGARMRVGAGVHPRVHAAKALGQGSQRTQRAEARQHTPGQAWGDLQPVQDEMKGSLLFEQN